MSFSKIFSQQNINTLLGLKSTLMGLVNTSGENDSAKASGNPGDKAERAHKSGKGQTDEHLFQQACYEAIIDLSKNEDLAPLFDSMNPKERLEQAREMVGAVEDVISDQLTPKERHLVVLTIGLREKSVIKKTHPPKKEGSKETPQSTERTSTANDSGRDIIIRLAMEKTPDKIAKRCRLMTASEDYKTSQWKKLDETTAAAIDGINSGIDSIVKERKPLPLWIDFIPFANHFLAKKYDKKINPHLHE